MLLPVFSLLALISIIPGTQAFVLRNSINLTAGTLNATSTPSKASTSSGSFKLSFVNFLESTNVHAYVTGQDSSGDLLILKQDGSDWITPEPGTKNITGIGIPLRNGQDGKPLRVLAPIHLIARNTSAFSNYFTPYLTHLWPTYFTHPLNINTQSPYPNASCTTHPTNSTLTCTHDSVTYTLPNATTIFSCNAGDFANTHLNDPVHARVYPRLCAALNRGCMMTSANQPCSESVFYPNDSSTPQNWYSRIVHENLSAGQGYAFAYDDNYKSGERDPSGLMRSAEPRALTVWVGGHPGA